MKKTDLLQPGEYASIPHAVLARQDLPATAKLVYQALADHLANGTTWVFPSIPRLASMTGASRATVMRSVDALESAGLVEADRRPGCPTRYRFADPSQKATGIKKRPVSKSDSTRLKKRPHPSQNETRTKPITTPRTTTPPQPPAEAGGESGENFQRSRKRKRRRRASLRDGDAEAIRHVWRDTTGGECDPAEAAELVEAYTLATVLDAIPKAFDRWGSQGKGRPFTWGWIRVQILQPRIIEEFRRAPPEVHRRYASGTLAQRARAWWRDKRKAER